MPRFLGDICIFVDQLLNQLDHASAMIADEFNISFGFHRRQSIGHSRTIVGVFAGFAEWNDRYRDGLRRFWRGDAGQRADFAARLAGSSDLFDRRTRRPWASVNYAASHDGYTLADMVSYIERHNEDRAVSYCSLSRRPIDVRTCSMRSAFSRDNKTLFLRMGLAQAVTIKHRTCIRSLASPPDQRAAAPIGPEQ